MMLRSNLNEVLLEQIDDKRITRGDLLTMEIDAVARGRNERSDL